MEIMQQKDFGKRKKIDQTSGQFKSIDIIPITR